MSNITNDQILETAHETVKWAEELAELWTNTTTGNVIDSQRHELVDALKKNDLEKVYESMTQLAQTCIFAEKEYEE